MTTATKITLFRVVMIPVFLVCMYLSEKTHDRGQLENEQDAR